MKRTKLTFCVSLLQGRHRNVRNGWYAPLLVAVISPLNHTRTSTHNYSHLYAFANPPLGTRFSKHFPGIRPYLLTLTTNFKIPIYRELLLLMGLRSVSKRSCSTILKEGSGNSICIVVGGAAESLSAHPGTADLTLLKR
jgi:hypothetical protein